MSATPYRKDFYAKLAQPSGDEAKVQEQLAAWLGSLEKNLQILKSFLDTKEAKW